ncbi:hypothetical protein [Fictibacillus phosphorivorans]|nr:hypothetical protein [Fictibacillus phosphorivorans]
MQKQLPKVELRDLTIEDAEDRYLWCLDEMVEKAFMLTGCE